MFLMLNATSNATVAFTLQINLQKINVKIGLKDIDKINKTAYNIYNSTRRAS